MPDAEPPPDRDDGPPGPGVPTRRPPTAAEARALGHPLRLRILFACRERARTNKELAQELGSTPGTIHYHLRQLLAQGFLRPEPPRRGPRGSREQPYRATGRSWELGGHPATSQALRRAGTDEVLAVADDDILGMARLGLTLGEEEVDELVRRLDALVEEFAARSRTAPSGAEATGSGTAEGATSSVTLFLAVSRDRPAG